jgi:hypothetical protein
MDKLIQAYPCIVAHLDMSVESETRGRLDQTTNLCTREILGDSRQLGDIDISGHDPIGPHLVRVNVEDLKSTSFVG